MSSVAIQRRIRQAGTLMQRNFDHMDPKLPSTVGTKRIPGEHERQARWVNPKDRIKQFNITIGDRVLVTTGDKAMKNKIGTVDKMDRTRNLVWLKEPSFRRTWTQPSGRKGMLFDPDYEAPENSRPRPIHYSNLKLVVSEPDDERVTIATRLRATKATWSLNRNAFTWSRIPEAIKEYQVQSNGSVRAAKKEVWEGDASGEQLVKERHERVPWPLEGLTPEERDIKRGKRPLTPGQTETSNKAINRDSFQPTLQPFRRNIPELQVPYQEFGGGRNSLAKRTARWNARNRDPDTGKIVVARRPVVKRRFARINWDRPTKAHPQGLPRKGAAQAEAQREQNLASDQQPVVESVMTSR